MLMHTHNGTQRTQHSRSSFTDAALIPTAMNRRRRILGANQPPTLFISTSTVRRSAIMMPAYQLIPCIFASEWDLHFQLILPAENLTSKIDCIRGSAIRSR